MIDPSRKRGRASALAARSHDPIGFRGSSGTGRPWIPAPAGRGGGRTTASSNNWRRLLMAFGEKKNPPSSQLGRLKAGRREVGAARIRLLALACRTLRLKHHHTQIEQLPVWRGAPSERASEAKECVREHRTPWAPAAGPAAGPWPDPRATTGEWAGLGTQQREARRLTLKSAGSLSPQAPSGPSALARRPRGELAELEIPAGPPGARSPSSQRC